MLYKTEKKSNDNFGVEKLYVDMNCFSSVSVSLFKILDDHTDYFLKIRIRIMKLNKRSDKNKEELDYN